MRLLSFSVFVLLLAGCGDGRDVTFRFEGLVGDEVARCGGVYEGVGLTGTELTLADFRLYVHEVRALTADGRELPVELEQDGVWQYEDVVLLDFEDGTAGCTMGTTGENRVVRGRIAEDVEVTGLAFVLGVPEHLNHIDASTAPSPLGFSSMFWGWNGGYKYLRVDGRSTGLASGFFVHLGATGCEGDGRGNVTGCQQQNRAEVRLDALDLERDIIAVDLAALFAESDLDVDEGGAPGCMSGFDDPDCEPIFHRLGLPFDGRPAETAGGVFRVRPALD